MRSPKLGWGCSWDQNTICICLHPWRNRDVPKSLSLPPPDLPENDKTAFY